MAHTVDEVRERTDLVAVVSRYVTLRRAGSRLVGLCPFHQEKTGSLSVDPQRQLWHCFGCGAGGNVFHFLMRIENLPFIEAAQRLAKEAGVELEGGRQATHRLSEQEQLARINLDAAGFFRRQLASKAGSGARAYLKERGLPPEVVEAFGIGYAPAGWEGLFEYLRSQGYAAAAITQTGLCAARPRGDGCYDRFRDRLMFPIYDLDERVVAFGGRTLGKHAAATAEGREEAKYINSPETPLFSKGKTLYGLNLARRAMGKAGRAILVEGYLDLVACHQFGFTETVATLGTALTEQHLRLLSRYTSRVYTAFDADSAGLAATLRSRELFAQAGLEARVLVMPAGHDPDSLLRQEGPEALQAIIAAAPDVVEYQLDRLADEHLGQPGGEARLSREAVPILAAVPDAVARAQYVSRLAGRMAAEQPGRVALLEQALLADLRRQAGSRRRGSPQPAVPPAPVARPAAGPAIEREVLAAMLQDEACRSRGRERLGEGHFTHAPYQALFVALSAGPAGALTGDDGQAGLAAELANADSGLVEDPAAFESALERLEESRLKNRVRQLEQQIRQAGGTNPAAALLEECVQVRRRLSELTGRRAVGTPSLGGSTGQS